MVRTKMSARKTRQESFDDRETGTLSIPERETRSKRRAEKVSEAGRKDKGKATASRDDSDEEARQLRRTMRESAREAQAERANAEAGAEPSGRQSKAKGKRSKSQAQPTGPYITTALQKEQFETLLYNGYSEAEAYTSMEISAARDREDAVREEAKANNPEALTALKANRFEGTAYPLESIMTRMGIREDFVILAENCSLLSCLTTEVDTYQEEVAQFLATVTFHAYDRRVTWLQDRDSGGYITFEVFGRRYRCTLRAIETLFGFRHGEAVLPVIDRKELDLVWSFLTHEPTYIAKSAKGNSIRNPGISYFRRAVAHVLFARDTTGPINKSEMEILVMALKDLIGSIDGRRILGDQGNASMAYVLVDHLVGYRERALRQMRLKNRRRASIGGVVTAIMRRCGVFLREEIDELPNNIGYRVMNLEYLIPQHMMHKESNGDRLFYRFRHPEREEAYIRLPRTTLTSLDLLQPRHSIRFIPPLSVLVNPEEADMRPTRAAHQQAEVEEDAGPETQGRHEVPEMPERHEMPVSPPRATAARWRRPSLQKRVHDWMKRKIKGLIRKGSVQDRRIREQDQKIEFLEHRVSDLESRLSGATSRGSPELQRQTSETLQREQEQDPRPARYSSVDWGADMGAGPSVAPAQFTPGFYPDSQYYSAPQPDSWQAGDDTTDRMDTP